MSFTSIVKDEASKIIESKTEMISELSAIIKCTKIEDSIIKIDTENNSVARKVYNIFKELYNINPKITVRTGYNFNKHYIYIIEEKDLNQEIITDLGLYDNNILNIPKDFVIADEELLRAYLRGVFLITGSINDPKTSRYHLEFILDDISYAKYISYLLNKFNLNSKLIKRDNKYTVYVKEAEKISDFLRIIGTTNALFYYEDIRIYRDHKNMTNRLNNCEQANVDKIVMSSNEQIKNIEKLKKSDAFEFLDDKLKTVAEYRLKYPDISLQELSEIITLETGNTITKSGLYHRLNKIKEISNKIKKL